MVDPGTFRVSPGGAPCANSARLRSWTCDAHGTRCPMSVSVEEVATIIARASVVRSEQRLARRLPCNYNHGAPNPHHGIGVPVPSHRRPSGRGRRRIRGERPWIRCGPRQPGHIPGCRNDRRRGADPPVAPRTARRQHNPNDGRSRTPAVARGPGPARKEHLPREPVVDHLPSRLPPSRGMPPGAAAGAPRSRGRHACAGGAYPGAGSHRGAATANGHGSRPASGGALREVRHSH